MRSPTRSIITVAVGPVSYFNMALTLARSVRYFNPSLAVYIVSDQERKIPRDLDHTHVYVPPCGVEKGFRSKLKLDQYAQTEETLFLDSDCIALGDLTPVFDAFKNHHVGVLGVDIKDGEWFGDVATICQRLHLDHMTRLNGGVYFFRASQRTTAIMDHARALLPRYDEIGFVRLRNQPNEEVLVSAAISHFGESSVFNSGQYYADFQWWPLMHQFSPLEGRAVLSNPPPPHPMHQTSFPADTARPIVLHFLGHHADRSHYSLASLSFALAARDVPFPDLLAHFGIAHIRLAESCKNFSRPAFRALGGVRRVRNTKTRYLE
jgi:hypothetical protein